MRGLQLGSGSLALIVLSLALMGCAGPDPAAVEGAVQATLTAMAPAQRPTVSPGPTATLILPPARKDFVPQPEVASVKGDPSAPVTIVEFSDYQ